ncbi:hypothetical protein HWV62_6511 [Athelia sp. TMB]|nr:hypothetical protein HWV62_6511 [Athelia sp. TMB]
MKLVRGVTGGDQAKTGYYAGIIESVFYAAEALTAFTWGRTSDIVGRKMPLVFGMVFMAASIMSFGLSNGYWPLVVSRFVQGITNGNIGITKSAMADMTDSTNMATAHPAKQWPNTLGKIAFLRQYPYALPCFVVSLVPLGAFVFTAVFFRETLPSTIRGSKRQSAESSPSTRGDIVSSSAPERAHPIRALLTKRIIWILINYAFIAWTEQANTVLVTLIYPTPVNYGGLGLSSFAVGIIMSSLGILIAFFSVALFPRAMARYSAVQVYRTCYAGYLINPILFPLMNLVALRRGVDATVWIMITMQVLASTLSVQAFGSFFILLSETAPTKSSFGAINGLAQTVACTMRIFAPFIASSLFSLSQEQNLLGGTMVFWIIELIIITGLVASFRIEDVPKGQEE